MEVAFRYRNERQFLGSLSYDTFGCSGSMELNPGLSEVVFGLRAEVEALKTRLNKIERGQEVAVSAAYWQAVERERDSSEKKKRHLLCCGRKKWAPLPRVPRLDASFSRLRKNTHTVRVSDVTPATGCSVGYIFRGRCQAQRSMICCTTTRCINT